MAAHTDYQPSVAAINRLVSGSPVTNCRYKMDAWGVIFSGDITGNIYVYVGGEVYWLDKHLYIHCWLDPSTTPAIIMIN